MLHAKSVIIALVQWLCFGPSFIYVFVVLTVYLFVFHSRSHAIFTINIVNKPKWDTTLSGDPGIAEDRCEDFVCTKLHIVDLAGFE